MISWIAFLCLYTHITDARFVSIIRRLSLPFWLSSKTVGCLPSVRNSTGSIVWKVGSTNSLRAKPRMSPAWIAPCYRCTLVKIIKTCKRLLTKQGNVMLKNANIKLIKVKVHPIKRANYCVKYSNKEMREYLWSGTKMWICLYMIGCV